jgi:hypothetical protein
MIVTPSINDETTLKPGEISFELFVSESDLKAKILDIWDNANEYWDVVANSENAYYSFLKFLWIDFPNGENIQLADYANENGIL